MRRVLSHPAFMLLVGILAVLFVLSLRSTQKLTTQRGIQVEKNQLEVESLKSKQEQLQKQLEESQLPFNQEKVLRNELRQQKEGDIVIQIPSIAPQISPPPSPTPTITNWKVWMEIIF
ncbi:MAG TPA: hypothetical protein PKJ26_04615 [Candidatus Woesebacteria bacterium]|nr:hypothetical protein [Candidatus Woesebacteria bacterium]HNS65748.1 hypothetical protein [Candidatus Woesebacteria bacterium]